MARQTPLIHFIGVIPGKYMALWPVFIVGDDPANLSFTVAAEDRDISLSAVPVEDTAETALRRRYVTTATAPARLPSAGLEGLHGAVHGVSVAACGAAGGGAHPAGHPPPRGGRRPQRVGCQGRTKIRPQWRRKVRPSGRPVACLEMAVRAGPDAAEARLHSQWRRRGRGQDAGAAASLRAC